MQITFDTTTITNDEVRGIFALLDTVRPIKGKFDAGYITKDQEDQGVREELAQGWVAGPSDTVATLRTEPVEETVSTFDGEEFPQSPVPPTIDANGLPWDERIHSGTKALNTDGTWRTKRGVDKALVASVEAELRQTYISGLDAANERVAELAGVEDAQTVLSAEQATVPTPPAPPAPVAPLAPAPTPTAPSPEPAESVPTPPAGVSPFVALMKRVTTAQGAGKLTQPRVKELLESLDKKSIMDLRTDEDALASFAVLLDGEGV